MISNGEVVTLSCGEQKYEVQIPVGVSYEVAELNKVKKADDVDRLILHALEHPIGCPEIENIVARGQSICIICDDLTRLTPVKEVLGVLLPKIEDAGVRKEDIFIVIFKSNSITYIYTQIAIIQDCEV